MALLDWIATARPPRPAPPSPTSVLFGDVRTGRILGEIDATAAGWTCGLNESGRIDSVTITEDVVRRLDLRWEAPAAKTFLAVELGDRVQEAGPIWSRRWDDEAGQLTLGAAGIWSLFDHRKVLPALLTAGSPYAALPTGKLTSTAANTDLGGIARFLVAQAMAEYGGEAPIVLPEQRTGTRTETFPGYKLLWVGDQLRELTKREDGAPDIRFRPRRNPEDRRFLQWVMETGTAAQPRLVQNGRDWVFDHTARRSDVVRISTDEDATVMGMRGFAIGQGFEAAQLISRASDTTLLHPSRGWPLLEVDELRPNVEVMATLDGHAANLRDRSARPIEAWDVTVRAAAAAEVLPGDYCRVVPKTDNAWLGRIGERRMRIARKAGDLGDNVRLTMYPLEAIL